ncbi:MAG: hypothetical protein ING36_02295 [Burkholderiales bacterium]|jgi:hypothetical protein|nr:hypothetical protein [Burkholderiales bacterium]
MTNTFPTFQPNTTEPAASCDEVEPVNLSQWLGGRNGGSLSKKSVATVTAPSPRHAQRPRILAGHLVPLRDWLGLDLLNSGDVSEKLDALLKSMMSPVAIHAVSSDANESAQQTQALREWNQMLELARQILSESSAALSKTLGALVDVQKAWLSTIGEAGDEMFSKKYAKDFWPAFCREWLGKSPYLLLAHQ